MGRLVSDAVDRTKTHLCGGVQDRACWITLAAGVVQAVGWSIFVQVQKKSLVLTTNRVHVCGCLHLLM
jgi:hypothetical protein